MDRERFDALVRLLAATPSRRAALGALAAGVAGAVAGSAGGADAKKKKKQKKRCKGGTAKCGGVCCPPGNCIGGACCPATRACGAVCCPAGQRCGDPESATCVAGQGTCAAGADTCAGDNAILCNGSDDPLCVCVQATDGTTRCATPIPGIEPSDCGLCSTDDDCELQFPGIVGVFCTENATGAICACPEGQNVCGRPCPVA